MAGLRFTELQSRPMEFLDFTSVTLDEFQQLVPPFEAAFHARMAAWRMDGKPRTARRFTVYKNCPLPTPEDRLFFILTYLKTYALQVVHGRLFGMVQGKANQWIHVLLPALLAALRALGDAPARTLTALAQRLGVSEAEAATVVVPLEEAPAPVITGPAAASASPLLPMTGPHGVSSAPKTLLHRRTVIAARKRIIRSKMFSWSMPCSRSSSSATPTAVASMISLLPT
jgi:Helix-turn-helix of DDE superfamily endonuclease